MSPPLSNRLESPEPPAPFVRLIEECLRAHGGKKQDYARDIGVSPTMLSQILAGVYRTPALELCLRVAVKCGRPIDDVLRAAGLDHIIELFDILYPPEVRHMLRGFTPRERALIAAFRTLEDDQARAIEVLAKRSAAANKAQRNHRTTPAARPRRKS